MNEQRGFLSRHCLFLLHDILHPFDFLRFPDVILIAEKYIICPTLPKQGEKISRRTEMKPLLQTGSETGIQPCNLLQQGDRTVAGTIVLINDMKRGIGLITQ